MRRALVVIACCFFAATRAAAQDLRGVVRDSASGGFVQGAVVMVLNAADSVLSRTISNDRGQYRVARPAGAATLRARRLGYRQFDDVLPAASDTPFDIGIARLPTLLERVTTIAAPRCPQRPDRDAALALLDQARAGLLSTIVTRETNPPKVVRLIYERSLDQSNDAILAQGVRIDSANRAPVAFGAIRGAAALVRDGFMIDSAGLQRFFGPDAEVLLDERFADAYCFRLMDARADRPHQVGLGFRVAEHRADIVDVDGALWVDTTMRTLVDIDFQYRGLDTRVEEHHPGGHVYFRELKNGIVFVDRWSIRLVKPENDVRLFGAPLLRRGFKVIESGGTLVRVSWADGFVWKASLGTLHAHIIDVLGRDVAGQTVYIGGSDYQARSDEKGSLEITNLLPGPYSIYATDPRLLDIGVELNAAATFVVRQDSVTNLTIRAPTDDYVAARCRDDSRTPSGDYAILGRVVDFNTVPIKGARLSFSIIESRTLERQLPPSYATGSNGIFSMCMAGLAPGMKIRVTARDHGDSRNVIVVIADRLTVVRLRFPQ